MPTSQFVQWITDQDIFGHTIGVNYRKSDTFKTKLGAAITVCTYTLMLVNLAILLSAFHSGNKQQETVATSTFDRSLAGPFRLQKGKFEFSILRWMELPSDIGRLVANQVTFDSEGEKILTSLPLIPCNAEKIVEITEFWDVRGMKERLQKMKEILCLDNADAYLESDRFSEQNFARV